MADGYGHLPRGPKRLMMAARWSAQFQILRAGASARRVGFSPPAVDVG